MIPKIRIYRDNRTDAHKKPDDSLLNNANKDVSCEGEIVADITFHSL